MSKFTINFIKHPTKEMFRVETSPKEMERTVHLLLSNFGKGGKSYEDHPKVWYDNINQSILIKELELETA